MALTAGGRLGHVISGLKIAGTAGAPLDVGLRLAGHDVAVDDVTIEGTMNVGIDIVNDGAISIRASRVSGVTGLPLRVGPAARPSLQRSVFEHRGTSAVLAVEIAPDAMPDLVDNIFLGYPDVLEADAARREQFLKQNLIVAVPRAGARSGRR